MAYTIILCALSAYCFVSFVVNLWFEQTSVFWETDKTAQALYIVAGILALGFASL